jgi:hypothetical protein
VCVPSSARSLRIGGGRECDRDGWGTTVICSIDGEEVGQMPAVEAAVKLEGAPYSVVSLACRRLVDGQVVRTCSAGADALVV